MKRCTLNIAQINEHYRKRLVLVLGYCMSSPLFLRSLFVYY